MIREMYLDGWAIWGRRVSKKLFQMSMEDELTMYDYVKVVYKF